MEALNLIPFEILDADGEMLLDKTNVSYLSTGRDLIRLQNVQSKDLSEPFVLAIPYHRRTTSATGYSKQSGLSEKTVSQISLYGTAATTMH